MTEEPEVPGTPADPDTPDEDAALLEDGTPETAPRQRTKVLLFLAILAAGAVLIAGVLIAIGLPTCPRGDLDWVPCLAR